MKNKTKIENKSTVYTCQECGSNNITIDEFNPEEWEGLNDGDKSERELGNHGTLTCDDCGHTQEYDA
jgi:RNase P subunit RPR2